MYRQEDILKALQEGADASALAQQFADALNAAIAQKNAEDAAKNQKVAEKMARMQAIIDEVFDFVDEFYPDLGIPADAREAITAEAMVDELDKTVAELAQLSKFLKANKNIFGEVPVVKVQKSAAPVGNADAIANFLKANGLA